MRKIQSYALSGMRRQEVAMPEGAEILCVEVEDDKPCIYAVVDTEVDLVDRTIEMYGNGQGIAVGAVRKYIGSYKMQFLGGHIFHCFEVMEG